MSTKLQTLLYGIATGALGFISWLVTLPPEQQTGLLGQFAAVCPPAWAPAVGFWSKLVASFSVVYMGYKAAHSGPQTPPANQPK